MTATPVADALRAKLQAAFTPNLLILKDESAKHAGHAGANPRGESHFHLTLRATCFNGKSRLERQRQVLALLQDELATRVHALVLDVAGSEEKIP